MKLFSKNTGDLFAELKSERDPQNFRERNQDEFTVPLHEYLESLLKDKGLNKNEVIAASQLNGNYAYHIFSGTRKNPSRPKILELAIAMGLNLDEIQYLLRYAKQSPLYPRNPWDSTIIFAVEQKLSVMETNELLYRLGETELLA